MIIIAAKVKFLRGVAYKLKGSRPHVIILSCIVN